MKNVDQITVLLETKKKKKLHKQNIEKNHNKGTKHKIKRFDVKAPRLHSLNASRPIGVSIYSPKPLALFGWIGTDKCKQQFT